MPKIKLTTGEIEYTFDVHPIDSELPETGGLYTVLKLNPDGKYGVLYIGRTNSFKTRHSDHHKAECFSENGATHIGLHHLENNSKRVLVEYLLQQNYKLVCEG